MELLKILAVCFIAAIFAVILKQYKGEYSLIITVAASITVITMIIGAVAGPVAQLRDKLNECGIRYEYFAVALKALGIGYVTGFIADACRDSGQASLALKAELAGKCAVFILCLPLITSVLDTALKFI